MPEAITAYRCEFGCGHVRTKRATIAAHEAKCFRNPEIHACQTCSHRLSPERAEYDERGNMTYPWRGWTCSHGDGPSDDAPRANCEFWEATYD